MMDVEDLMLRESQFHMPTYARLPVVFVKGKGTRLWDAGGREYLDFVSGLGVANVGHCHPRVIEAVERQLRELVHVSNLYYTVPQVKLAEKLAELTFGDTCFFGNSGAEANEGAIKLARRYARLNGNGGHEVITAYGSFHGRTMKTLAASGQPEKQKPFEPLPPGFHHVPLNDLAALVQALDRYPEVSAVLLEVIQGEGGVHPCETEYLREVRNLCTDRGLLLILDEVQTGVGRTGKLFAHEHYGIEPDVMSVAKGLASGLPIGVLIATDRVGRAFMPGDHASTFGGGPVVCAAALATLGVIEEEGLIENCARMGAELRAGLEGLVDRKDSLKEVRGRGLMLALEMLDGQAKEVVRRLLESGIVVNNIGDSILRFLPPLTVGREEIERLLLALEGVL